MIVFDTETTGLIGPDALPLSKQPKIIEFGAVKLDDKTLKEVAVIDFLCHPGHALSPEITKITGITDTDLEGKPPFQSHYQELAEFFLGERIVVAHNLMFDLGMLEMELRRMSKLLQFPWPFERRCTVELTTHLKGHRLKLADLYALAMKGAKPPVTHRAIEDVRTLVTAVRWMRKENLI